MKPSSIAAVQLLLATLAQPAGASPAKGRLTAERNRHAVTLAGGPKLRIEGATDWGGTAFVGYRYGITDELEYRFPFQVGFRWGSTTELSVGGGLAGIQTQRVEDDSRTQIRLPLQLGVAVRPGWGSGRLTVVANFLRNQDTEARASETGAAAGVNLRVRVTTWLTLHLPVEATVLDAQAVDETRWLVTVGGLGTDGYGALPVAEIHLIEQVDLLVAPGVTIDLRRERHEVMAIAGIEWRI